MLVPVASCVGVRATHDVTYWPGHASVFGATGGSKTAESNTCTNNQMKCVMCGGVTSNMCRSVFVLLWTHHMREVGGVLHLEDCMRATTGWL